MISLKTLAACAALATVLSATAQAQEINTFTQGASGSQAEIARLRSYGNAFAQTWVPAVYTGCPNVSVGSNPAAPNTGPGWAVPYDPNAAPTVTPPNVVTQNDPLQQTTVTGTITSVCFARGQ